MGETYADLAVLPAGVSGLSCDLASALLREILGALNTAASSSTTPEPHGIRLRLGSAWRGRSDGGDPRDTRRQFVQVSLLPRRHESSIVESTTATKRKLFARNLKLRHYPSFDHSRLARMPLAGKGDSTDATAPPGRTVNPSDRCPNRLARRGAKAAIRSGRVIEVRGFSLGRHSARSRSVGPRVIETKTTK